MKYKILSVHAGHGSTFLSGELHTHRRPDVVFHDQKTFDPNCALTDKPTKCHIIGFKKRTFGWYDLNPNITIEKNMVKYLIKINSSNKMVMITSELCRMGPFFTCNPIENVICVVRHPLHAMVSYLTHQHREKVKRFKEGFNSVECVEYYAKIWNEIVSDHINANSKIIRYEFVKEDASFLTKEDEKLKNLFVNRWRSDTRNFGVLNTHLEELLKQLVKINYDKLYERWDV